MKMLNEGTAGGRGYFTESAEIIYNCVFTSLRRPK